MKRFWNQYKEKFYSALLESVAKALGGIAVIYFTYTLFPSVGGKEIKNIFLDLLKTQYQVTKSNETNISNDTLIYKADSASEKSKKPDEHKPSKQ